MNVKKVLLLNASEEVLKVIQWQHAVKLLMTGKARKPFGYNDEYEIRTTSGVFRLPTAIVLMQYVHVPYKNAAVNRENVLRRDEYLCGFCNRKLTSTTGTIEHLQPQSRGGKHEWMNVIAACKDCNNKKDSLTLKEAEKKLGMKLLRKPFIPSRDFIVLTGLDIKTHETWSRWIPI